MLSEALHKTAQAVPRNSVPWFDLLDRLGLFEKWLTSDSREDNKYATWLLSAPTVWEQRSARVAQLIRLALVTGGEQREDVLQLFQRGPIHESREMFDLFLKLLHEGAFDTTRYYSWTNLHDIGQRNPAYAAELISRFIDRIVAASQASNAESPFDDEARQDSLELTENVFTDAVDREPAVFVRFVLPQVVRLIKDYAVSTENGRVLDHVWAFRPFGYRHDFKDFLFEGLADAMEKVAIKDPILLDQMTVGLDVMPHQNIAALLLGAWSANGVYFADRIVKYLLANQHRLSVGYSMWDSGNGVAAVSRAAIKSSTPHCTESNLRTLEEAILAFYPQVEKERPKSFGYTQYLLLNAVDPARRSDAVSKRMRELDRKFPKVDFQMPSFQVQSDGVVHSPIPKRAAEKMTDEQWLSAMRTYDNIHTHQHSEDFLKGGALELSSQLQGEASRNPSRFASLLLRMNKEIPQFYFEALIRGIVAHKEPESADVKNHPIQTSVVVDVVRHVYRFFGVAAGLSMAHAISDLAERDLPDEILAITAKIATDAPDPDEELWKITAQGGNAYYGGDPLTHGLNTSRGAAAHAIARLLFADHTRFLKLREAITSVVNDESIAVRANGIECLIAMLNIEPVTAVTLFLESVKGVDSLWEAATVDRFLYYTVFTHYERLRDLLLKMLDSSNADVRESAAQKIALASFRSKKAASDLEKVLQRDEVSRAAVAYIDASNLHREDCAELSRTRLMRFFADPSKKVREQAARCFRQLNDEQLSHEVNLINSFIESPAFEANATSLLMKLEGSVAQLPDIICRIPERAVSMYKNRDRTEPMESRWWTDRMATLVLRLHEQTADPNIKKRCLDVIDSMIELNFGGVGVELTKLET